MEALYCSCKVDLEMLQFRDRLVVTLVRCNPLGPEDAKIASLVPDLGITCACVGVSAIDAFPRPSVAAQKSLVHAEEVNLQMRSSMFQIVPTLDSTRHLQAHHPLRHPNVRGCPGTTF